LLTSKTIHKEISRPTTAPKAPRPGFADDQGIIWLLQAAAARLPRNRTQPLRLPVIAIAAPVIAGTVERRAMLRLECINVTARILLACSRLRGGEPAFLFASNSIWISASVAFGYSGKLLGAAQVKKFGKHSLGMTLGATCCKLVLVEDPEATAKMMARAKKRQRPIRETKSISDDQSNEPQVRVHRLTI
jgi:hypothetical protein